MRHLLTLILTRFGSNSWSLFSSVRVCTGQQANHAYLTVPVFFYFSCTLGWHRSRPSSSNSISQGCWGFLWLPHGPYFCLLSQQGSAFFKMTESSVVTYHSFFGLIVSIKCTFSPTNVWEDFGKRKDKTNRLFSSVLLGVHYYSKKCSWILEKKKRGPFSLYGIVCSWYKISWKNFQASYVSLLACLCNQ